MLSIIRRQVVPFCVKTCLSCPKGRFYSNGQVLNFHMQRSVQRCKVSICSRYNSYTVRIFHTTSIRKAAPLLGPFLVKLMSPVSRLLFLLVGRRFRKWWSALPAERRAMYLHKLTKNRNVLIGTSGTFGAISAGYYVYHLEETPITGRRRFIILNQEQTLKVMSTPAKLLTAMLSNSSLPEGDARRIRVYRIMDRIFQSNDLDNTNLSKHINVIVSDEVNAFVLPDGRVFVFTGMLDATISDHELAGILGHELSHVLLNHPAEKLSRAGFFNVFSIIILASLWAIVPSDILSILLSLVQSTVEDILIELPYSRKLEKEADEIGMMLAAKACYDVTQIPQFWERMNATENSLAEAKFHWLSTHPAHKKRMYWLNETLPRALKIHDEMKCPRTVTSFFTTIRKGFFG